ncbi:MAG: quinolinate synthase NadA, partial [Chroococcidiopsis sp.]
MFTTAIVQNHPIREIPVDLFAAIQALKQELNAVILAHYYQEPDIQDIADYIGDSLGLAQQAAKTNAAVIVFAGVHFMAETAKILNPNKLVLLPDLAAGCSLADSCPSQEFAAFKAAHPDHLVISYINCTAEIKAMSDIICTSSNAVQIVRQIPLDRPIIFAPDRNLGRYVMQQTGRNMLLWQGSCIVHETFSEKKLVQLKIQHPVAEVLAHPECEPPILRHADYVGSTTALLKYCQKSSANSFIVATE